MLTKQEASILRRSALTIDATDRFGRIRASILDGARLWCDEAAAEDMNEELASILSVNLNLYPSLA